MRKVALLLLVIPAVGSAAPTVGELGIPPDAMDGELWTRTADRLVTLGRIPQAGEVEEGAVRMALIGVQRDHLLAPTGWLDADTANVLGVRLGSLADEPVPGDVLPLEGHEQEAIRLRNEAAELQRLAVGAGTPAARTRLLEQAAKAREVAAFHVAAGRPSRASGSAPPVIPVEALTRAQVVALQQALGVPGSGVMDEATRAALTAYQASRGRAATGALDVASVNELLTR